MGCDRMFKTQDRITVGVVHRQQLFLEGLKQLISSNALLQVVADGTSKETAYRIGKNYQPDILVLDANLVEKEDLIKAKDLLQDWTNISTNIILISDQHFETEFMMTALECGIHGFLLKDLGSEMLIEVIIAVHKGEFWLHPQASGCLVNAFQQLKSKYEKNVSGIGKKQERPHNLLTKREWEVLERIANGDNNQSIVASLGISEPTVKAHVSHIIQKLNVNDRTNAALLAIKNGWVEITVNEENDTDHTKKIEKTD